MSGDVQPRKRKDKKKKKDELGLEEPRGTAAALGDGDVFIHSQHEHGTGGHWCAKIIFFSLLAVLITLIGLIILENRGLTELEANSVESKYSGVLEGWIEEAPEDDHYDQHTLDLKHPADNDEDDHVHKSHHDENDEDQETPNEHDEEEDDDEHEQDEEEDDDEHEQDEDEDNESNEIDGIDGDNDEISEEDVGETEEVEERVPYRRYNYKEKYNTYDDDDDDNDDDDDDEDDNEDNKESDELEENDENLSDQENDIASVEQDGDDDDVDDDNIDNEEESANYVAEQENDEEDENNDDEDNNGENYQADSDENDIEENYVQEDADDDEDDEIEKIEAEKSDEVEKQDASKEDDDDDVVDNDVLEDEDDDDEPPVEQITTPPAGKPFIEIEEETTVKPIDTLAEEFEYERRQEELRKEKEEQGSQMWLKLAVGGALLVATHAVLRRATARDAPEPEDRSREETPSMADRRMTLIPDEPVVQQSSIGSARPIADEEVFKKPAPVFKNEPIIKPNITEELKEKKILAEESKPITQEYERDEEEKELYSDEEEIVEEEEEEEEIDEPPKVTPEQKAQPASKEDSDPEEVPDDVEIIDDEQIEEEVEEEDDDEEEISDVDDTELLSRLEAKYGRLPEPERPGRKDGGNSIDEWPGEPIEPYWREQLDIAEEELRQGALASCEKRVSAPNLANSGRAKWTLARAIDASAEAKKDNKLLSKAISAYLNLLKINERLSDRKLVEVAQRTIDRIQFRGVYLNAEPIYRLLIRRFPQDINYRNNLTISFLMANRADLADEVLRETLKLWPNDRVALAHHGFVLKNQYNKLEEAVVALQKALEGDAGSANEPRFYYHLGDALLLLGRVEEAHEVHVRGAELGHFLSPTQRSLYNVPRLRSRPWWPVEETPYVKLAQALEKSWREILKEAEAAKDLYEQEKEGLKEKGEWSQLDIFVRGRELPGRCSRAPVTCGVVRAEAAAAQCRRGQVKFSALAAGTRVRAHVGPTNCRLRLHLALSNTARTYIRVDNEIREWQLGKTFIFDDSFEHEVWHNGTGTRLVLIVDLWHPDLTPQERRTLPAI